MLDDIKYFKKTYVKYPNYDYIYHIYHKKLEEKPKIIINPEEHKEYVWKTPKEALQENFIQDLDVCIRMFYNLL